MFIACPHCQFIIARDVPSGEAPADCPRCGKPLATGDEAPTPAPSLATLLHPAPQPVETATVETQVADAGTTEAPSAASVETPTHEAPADAHGEPAASVDDDVDVSNDDAAHDDANAAIDSPSTAPVPVPVAEAPGTSPRKTAGPRFLHRTRTTSVHARRARLHGVAVAALSLLLCVQVVIADRARLATQAGWRPLVTALCDVFRCDVPTWREPTAFSMLSRDVRPLPDMPGTLQAQATFRNEARWAQAWPVILLTLKDADGRTLGARALQPGDYLPAGEPVAAIGPGQSAQMAVRIREPSASVVAFSFDFR